MFLSSRLKAIEYEPNRVSKRCKDIGALSMITHLHSNLLNHFEYLIPNNVSILAILSQFMTQRNIGALSIIPIKFIRSFL